MGLKLEMQIMSIIGKQMDDSMELARTLLYQWESEFGEPSDNPAHLYYHAIINSDPDEAEIYKKALGSYGKSTPPAYFTAIGALHDFAKDFKEVIKYKKELGKEKCDTYCLICEHHREIDKLLQVQPGGRYII